MAGQNILKKLTNALHGSTPPKWAPLDNAAKIFPPTAHGADTGVFRMSCELNEKVNPELLQKGLDDALKQFQHMRMVMRHGLFWYYLEQTSLKPVVVPEHAAPCSQLYVDSKSLLFEVSYWRNKINLEVFHVLTDGNGAFSFFRAILTRYLALCHPQAEIEDAPKASVFERREDSFQRYYQKHRVYNPVAGGTAYHLKGQKRPEGGLSFIEGVAQVRQALDAAHRYNTTLTVYLTAALFEAIHKQMYLSDMHKPVVLTVPVNLRSFFPSETARNFFGVIRVKYNFKEQSSAFEDIIADTARQFRENLTPERLEDRINQMSALEHHPFIRIVPLVIKDPIMRFAGYLSDRAQTATISNVGRFELPEKILSYVRGLGIFMSTYAIQICAGTCAGKIHFGISSAFADPIIQRGFFSRLVSDGVDIEIRSNEHHREETK